MQVTKWKETTKKPGETKSGTTSHDKFVGLCDSEDMLMKTIETDAE